MKNKKISRGIERLRIKTHMIQKVGTHMFQGVFTLTFYFQAISAYFLQKLDTFDTRRLYYNFNFDFFQRTYEFLFLVPQFLELCMQILTDVYISFPFSIQLHYQKFPCHGVIRNESDSRKIYI